MTRKRITFTMDARGFVHLICADEDVEVYVVDPSTTRDRVCLWNPYREGACR